MFEKLRGVKDFYPEDFYGRNLIYEKLCETVKKYGFKEVCTPSIENLDMFTKKSGEGIVDEIYTFKDKGGRDVCLIPELTPSIARMVVQRQKVLTKPIKWFSLSRHWRYERPQKGRQREFYQFNVDIMGSRSSRSDFEILACGIDCLLALGIKNFMFYISDRRILEAFFSSYGINANEAFNIVDKRSKVDEKDFKLMLGEIGVSEDCFSKLIEILDIKGTVKECIPKVVEIMESLDLDEMEALKNLEEIGTLLASYGFDEHCRLDLSIVRGLAYYTDMVFEVYDRKRSLRSLFGGGRYDDLIELFGGQRMPAVGFAIGLPTLELLMKEEGIWPNPDFGPDYFVITIGKVDDTAFSLIRRLREGHTVEYSFGSKNLSNQMNLANNIGAKKVIILGERDLKDDNITVKDMNSGKQEKTKLKDFLKKI